MVSSIINTPLESSEWRLIDPCGLTDLSLTETLSGGQSFVWDQEESGDWEGVIAGTRISLRLNKDSLAWKNQGPKDFSEKELIDYLWLDDSYREATDNLPWRSDPFLKLCMDLLPGLRILKQPLDETLFYFLLSPVKSIPQIKEIGSLIAKNFGEDLGQGKYAFPGWSRLAEISEGELRQLKLGYRAKNVAGTANFLKTRPNWLPSLSGRSYSEAKIELMKLPGVGPKIADCVLLFGARKYQAFPIDTWIEKVLSRRYGLSKWNTEQKLQFAELHFGSFAGLAQQFFFSAERLGKLDAKIKI